MIGSAFMVGVGALGTLAGAFYALATWEAPSFGGSSASRGDVDLAVGLVAAGCGTLLIVGAVWLGIVDRLRRRLDAAMEPSPLRVSVGPHGGGASLVLDF